MIGGGGCVEYKTNLEGESYTQLGVSAQRVKLEDGHNYQYNLEGETYDQRVDRNVLGEEPDHIEHTYLVKSNFNLKGNSGSVYSYSTIPEDCEGREEGEGMADDSYTYAYAHIPDRGTNKYCF